MRGISSAIPYLEQRFLTLINRLVVSMLYLAWLSITFLRLLGGMRYKAAEVLCSQGYTSKSQRSSSVPVK